VVEAEAGEMGAFQMKTPKFFYVACFVPLFAPAAAVRAEETPAPPRAVVENDRLAAVVDRSTGVLAALENKLTGETYTIGEDQFEFKTDSTAIRFQDVQLAALDVRGQTWNASYRQGQTKIEAVYTLDDHFLRKQLAIVFAQPTALLRAEVSRPRFATAGLKLMEYSYPKFGRKPGEEPCRTFFGRTAKGGLFAGVGMPFADTHLDGSQVHLAFAPHLKLAAGERFECEPVYFGVYRRLPNEADSGDEPSRSESDAMVAMTSAVLGPPRHGLAPMACGWHSEMQNYSYTSPADVEADMKSLDFLAECGIDWVSDSHPWGGEIDKINQLGADGRFQIGELTRQFLDHARQTGVQVVMWSTMTNSHPWWDGHGKGFRSDLPRWQSRPDKKRYDGTDGRYNGDLSSLLDRMPPGNCVANKPFMDWLSKLNLDIARDGQFRGWCVDGDFFGTGGYYTTIVPVTCLAEGHDHLPGDANFCCQRALARFIADVRKQQPQMYIFTCRPAQDLGVWALHNIDACFTLVEDGGPPDNLAAGDGIRKWSRIRVHRDFFPHYIDQPLLFPSCAGTDLAAHRWRSHEHLDFILLSALSSSPNQLFYLPTKGGIPDEDKATLRHWLDWGREYARFLLVRKDLPDWPTVDKVDGSAHIVEDQGLVFLFNSGKQPLEGRFALTDESIGLKRSEQFRVLQHYPVSEKQVIAKRGETILWQVPPETALVLEIQPAR